MQEKQEGYGFAEIVDISLKGVRNGMNLDKEARVIKIICLLGIIFMFSGCMAAPFGSLSKKTNAYIKDFRKQSKSKQTILKASYLEAFKAVISVFRDLDIKILKKDLEGKVIFGSLYPEKYFNHYAVFFEDKPENEIEVTLKASGMLLDQDFILEKIREEIDFQRQLDAGRN